MAPPSAAHVKRLAHQVLTCKEKKAAPLLRRLGFKEPRQALQVLDRLAGPAAPGIEPLPAQVLAAVARTGMPDRALRHLERLVNTAGTPTFLYARFKESPRLTEYLARLLSHSTFLADILVRNPEYLFWLFEDTPFLSRPLAKQTLLELLRRAVDRFTEPGKRVDALRRIQRRELLRIGAAEVLQLKEVEHLCGELSDLADAVLEIVLEEVTREMVRRYGRPRNERGQPAHFCLVCLGKHGGRELNYSSDIDLLFVYDEEGQTRPRRPSAAIDNSEFFRRLGERLVQVLTEVTPEGFLYRVDMRLRPEGEAGPLSRSLRRYWIYYETRGELWEKQMLIKARRAAGSQRLWKRFTEMLIPFMYPAHFTVRPQEEIRRIKERIEAQILEDPTRDNNIKLQAGGIRDIEFIVQCLQLLSGRINPRIRHHNTLEAISQLEQAAALSSGEAEDLRRAYVFFRRLENLLQIQEGRSVYAVPEERAERAALAGLLELKDTRALGTALRGHRKRVRSVYDNLFYGAREQPDDLKWLLEAGADSPRAREALAPYPFDDPTAFHRNLLQLASADMLTSTAREHFEELLPMLLASLAAAPDPDQGMVHFARIVNAYGAPGTFYELLRTHPNFRELLISICSTSRFLSELIQRDPGLLDGLFTPDADGGAAEQAGWRGDLGAARRFRNQALVRIGTDDLLGLITAEETFLRLSELAEKLLRMVYKEAWRRLVQRQGKPRDRRGKEVFFACFAGGKFGGRELVFGSDLDLFFVYEDEGRTGRTRAENSVFFIELAQEMIHLLHANDLYEVDVRLRPEGRSAPMALSLPAYRHYLNHRASTWERLALTRARLVAGDADLGKRVQRAIHRFVFRSPVDAATIAEMLDVRHRMEPRQERGRPLQVDIKRGPGGLVDIEFIAQILVLKLGKKRPKLRLTGTRQVLLQVLQLHHLNRREGRFLLDAYDRLREVEKAMRRASNQASQVLPGERELAPLARSLGQQEPEALLREVEDLMRETRRIFTRLFADFARSGE